MAPRVRLAPCERGFALLIVMWSLILLSVMVGAFSISMRTEAGLAGNYIEKAQAETLAEGGLRLGLARLLLREPEHRWHADGTVNATSIAGYPVRVSIRSESGKVDLNSAPEGLLDRIAEHLGRGEPSPRGFEKGKPPMTDALLDWRDSDRNRKLAGAEDPQYAARGSGYGSRDGPLLSIYELTQVMGVEPALFRRLAPLVTIHSGQRNVDPATAPLDVMLALGISEAQDIERARNADAVSADREREPELLAEPSRPDQARPGVFTVVAEATVGQAVARRAVVARVRSLAGEGRGLRGGRWSGNQPFWILSWLDDVPAGFMGDAEPAPENAPAEPPREIAR